MHDTPRPPAAPIAGRELRTDLRVVHSHSEPGNPPAARPPLAPSESGAKAVARAAARIAALPVVATLALAVPSPSGAQESEPRPTEDPFLYSDTENVSRVMDGALTAGPDLPPWAIPDGFVQVDRTTMDPFEILQVRAFDIEGERIGSVSALLPEGAEGAAVEAAVIESGGFLGLFDRETAIPLSRLAVLADADGNGMRVVVAATAEEIAAMPDASGG